jgi:two-component SAPR family response regulator
LLYSKPIEGVDMTVWYEEVYLFPLNKEIIIDTFRMLIDSPTGYALPMKPAILVLDDDYDIVQIFTRGLERKYGKRVFGFTDPFVALDHFKMNLDDYAVLISDIRMPKMNGYEFVKRAKEIKYDIKICLITAFEINNVEFSKVLPSIKIDEFIQKPISLDKLTEIIDRHFSKKTNTTNKKI